MTHLLVSEWGRVPVLAQTSDRGFSRAQANALIAAARAHPLGGEEGAGILSDHYGYLRAKQMVGVIAAPGCSLEILPKVDPMALDEMPHTVRARLVRMLDIALGLDIGEGATESMAQQNATLLDILIRLFADRLLAETRRGFPRAYLPQEEDLSALRGRLNVGRQFTIHVVRPDRLACRYDTLSPDIALMQVMKACTVFLAKHARAAETRRRLDELRFVLADITDVPPAALPWERVRIDRTSRRWGAIHTLARLFLRREWQATHHDATHDGGITLLFPMNTLFEAYVAALAARALRGTGLTVHAQGGRLSCLTDEDGHSRFQTKPDVLIRRNGQTMQVIDTKWKRLHPVIDDPKHGINQDDVYQMLAYGRLYACPGLLLYPHHASLGPEAVSRSFTVTGCTDRLRVASLDVSQGEDSVSAALVGLLASPPQPAGHHDRW